MRIKLKNTPEQVELIKALGSKNRLVAAEAAEAFAAFLGPVIQRSGIQICKINNYMKNKVWHKVVIATEEQNVEIFPTEGFDGIIIQTKELDDKTYSPRLYLTEDEMELLISKMREMMEYVKK